MEESKIILSEREIPTTWYNIIPDLPCHSGASSQSVLKNQLGRKILLHLGADRTGDERRKGL